MAQLLEDAAINAGWEPWQVEALLDHLTPAVLADMVNDPADRSAVTRQPSPLPKSPFTGCQKRARCGSGSCGPKASDGSLDMQGPPLCLDLAA